MKKALKILAVLLLLIAIAGYWFYTTLLPDYNGTTAIEHLKEEVVIRYDDYGIPHIYARNDADAFTALGYVHAQDRLWQMELLRRIAPGRLSEVFGKELIDTDKLFIGLGIDEASAEAVKSLDTTSQSYQLANAYLKGINQFVANGATPVEFYLTGLDKTEFTMQDIHNVFGYMSFSFAMAHKTDPLLTQIQAQLGDEYLNALGIESDPNTAYLKNYPKKEIDSVIAPDTLVTVAVHNALNKLPVPQFIGSNSWVLAPQKTATGKVLFENDPHIAFSQPAVWYEAHVVSPNYEMYGYHLAGTPFPMLGHNREIAYGMTMFQNDDLDFYREENDPQDSNAYRTPVGWELYKTRQKTIVVKDAENIEFSVKTSRHGPILNDVITGMEDSQPVAVSWEYLKHDNEILEASYLMSHAKNRTDFEKCLPKIHAPGLNIMYGDADNNIAWYAVGKLFERPKHVNSKVFLNGASGKDEIIRYLETSENPRAVNPPWNYVYSSNNQPDSIGIGIYPGYYLPENRASRIVSLIEAKDDWTKEDIMNMSLDVTSEINATTMKNVIEYISSSDFSEKEKEAILLLKRWNGSSELQEVAPTIFHKFVYRFLKNTLADELSETQFDALLKTHLSKRIITPLLTKENIWHDNVETSAREDRKQILLQSFRETIDALEAQLGPSVSSWTWNRVHTVEHQHPIGKVEQLRSYFNVGPYKIHGTGEVLNNLGFHYNDSGVYETYFGPSTRRIIDFSDIENSVSILPTGQSGNPLSPHYNDQAEMYVNGEFRKMMMNSVEIEQSAKNTLTLKPKM